MLLDSESSELILPQGTLPSPRILCSPARGRELPTPQEPLHPGTSPGLPQLSRPHTQTWVQSESSIWNLVRCLEEQRVGRTAEQGAGGLDSCERVPGTLLHYWASHGSEGHPCWWPSSRSGSHWDTGIPPRPGPHSWSISTHRFRSYEDSHTEAGEPGQLCRAGSMQGISLKWSWTDAVASPRVGQQGPAPL